MIYIIRINNTEYEVEVEQGTAEIIRTDAITAVAPAAPISVAAPTVAAPVAVSPTGGEPVDSPMPGNILVVSVKPGEQVKAGQLLVVLEAMKMENEILAPHDGVIKDVLVNKGAVVATGDVLVTIA